MILRLPGLRTKTTNPAGEVKRHNTLKSNNFFQLLSVVVQVGKPLSFTEASEGSFRRLVSSTDGLLDVNAGCTPRNRRKYWVCSR